MYWSILMFQHIQLFGRLNRKPSCVCIRVFCELLAAGGEKNLQYGTTEDCEKEGMWFQK